jgi:hypothetical protein
MMLSFSTSPLAPLGITAATAAEHNQQSNRQAVLM